MTAITIDEMGLVSAQGCVDLHLHSWPCYLATRSGDDWQIARSAADAGMRALVLKSHNEPTVSRAYLLSPHFPTLSLYGGVALNRYVGGINPSAVEAALRLGGKMVWMPTFDSAHHMANYGGKPARWYSEGIRALQDGKLAPAVRDVLEVIAQYDAILATGHLSPDEVRAVVGAAWEAGVHRVLVNHPLFKGSNLPLALCQELATQGAYIEFQYTGMTPIGQWEGQNLTITRSFIQALGPEHCVAVSDGGQRYNPLPAECMRLFGQCLVEVGFTAEEVGTMMIDNPKTLLGIE